jgi:hypothetical protein
VQGARRSLAVVIENGSADGADPAARPRRRRADRLLGEAATPSPERAPRPVVEVPTSVRRAALAVAAEALLLGVLAVVLLVLTLTGDAASLGRALAEVLYVGLGAAALTAGAVGLWRLSSWSRAPVVVLQVLLGLLGFTTAFDGGRPLLGLPVLVLVVATLYLLATPEARLAFFERDG